MKDGIDQDDVHSIKELMGDKFGELVERYIVNSRIYIQEIHVALESKDAVAVARSAHALKSPSYMIGMKALGELAENIEGQAKDQGERALGSIALLMPLVEAHFAKAEEFLDAQV